MYIFLLVPVDVGAEWKEIYHIRIQNNMITSSLYH